MIKRLLVFCFIVAGLFAIAIIHTGCAQISSPSGGPRDTIPPVLEKATPANGTVNFTGNRIVLTFNEYIDLQDISNNILVSPLQKNNPQITFNFRTVNIKFRDTLLPNTTYSISFGDALKDLNEGNPLKGLVYTFSTGDIIDSLSLAGNVVLAESGKTDSTLMVMLYRNASDSAVLKIRPNYIAKVQGNGSFRFNNLPSGNFRIYALKDGDGGKTYNSKTETFAFIDREVSPGLNADSVILYAYQEVKSTTGDIKPSLKAPSEKLLKINTNLQGQPQDLLSPLELIFNNSIKVFDESRIFLTDTNFIRIPNASILFDSSRKKATIAAAWKPGKDYRLVIPKDAIQDSAGNFLLRNDTLRFSTRTNEDYGKVLLRFKNLDLSKRPVIQFVQGDEVKMSFALTALQWSNQLFTPGEYNIRILYDDNNNGKWDPGNFKEKKQPEKAVSLPQALQIRPNWDNERDIIL